MIKFHLLKIDKNFREPFEGIIYLTREHLIRGLHNLKVSDIKLNDFQYGKLSEEQKLNARMIVFKENNTFYILKRSDIMLKREDMFPTYSLVSLEDMELSHFYNTEKVRYAHNIIYEDEFNGCLERKVLKYKTT